jgi:hypothetical protein
MELKAERQRLVETLRSRKMGWNHEQGAFSKVETLGISRAEKALGKKFQPSTVEGVDMIDVPGMGKLSLKGPFVDDTLKPLSSDLQKKSISNIKGHIKGNTAVDKHIIDTLGLDDANFKLLNDILKDVPSHKYKLIR